MPASLSLVTCARDPGPAVFRRVLEAIAGLEVPPGCTVEHLVIDSTSEPPLASRREIAAHVGALPTDGGRGTGPLGGSSRPRIPARVLRCEERGLAAARRLAIAEAAGELLVWFDDDNVPDPDYLTHVVATAATHPDVTVWGAGTIAVEFTGPVPPWVERDCRPTFQERAHGRDEFGSAREWAPFFPVGSGLVTRRHAAMRWADATTAGRYSLTGRAGRALTAGDDAQLILGAVAAGERVGVVAAQRLVHLIPPARCTPRYLARLEFGLSGSIRVARAECFPHDPAPRATTGLGLGPAVRETFARWRRAGARQARFELARQLGALSGALQAARRPEPVWLRAAIGITGLR